ncbi:MAG: YggS family pyridoxal phosphate-dependent enzyme [Gammaproteobacteria bacterium]|nr:YggS family pyridoxal phosphate-dependent enzyme [Gammaproteobacteria bacterium]MBL7000349.1 YggS family pyridoxal phosphate-dependent enzyme [Gammaproteobacteria bacterium]
MHNIEKNLALIQQKIELTARQFQRDPQSITLLAVSKTKPVSDIQTALRCGQHDFGESYLQEAEHKISALDGNPIVWHYIGSIQSNKTRKISALFDWVHSVERFKIARQLDAHRPLHKAPLNILLQVNIDNEASKSGIPVHEVSTLAEKIEQLPRVRLRGLMAIPAIHTDPQQQREPYRKMQQAFIELQRRHPQCDTLSMGMSDDMQAAIAEGSTLVRIGTAIFGPRL